MGYQAGLSRTIDRRTPPMPGAPARAVAVVTALLAIVMAGCSPTVRVEAPSEPIEINLNVRITQEVRIRVDRELEEAFEENEDIF